MLCEKNNTFEKWLHKVLNDNYLLMLSTVLYAKLET